MPERTGYLVSSCFSLCCALFYTSCQLKFTGKVRIYKKCLKIRIILFEQIIIELMLRFRLLSAAYLSLFPALCPSHTSPSRNCAEIFHKYTSCFSTSPCNVPSHASAGDPLASSLLELHNRLPQRS